jgi:hypothetical protein
VSGDTGKGSAMAVILLIAMVVLNVPLYVLLGKSFFGGWGEFLDAVVAMLDRYAYLNEERRAGKLMLLLFLVSCVAIVAAEYHVVAKFLFGIAEPWRFR